MAHMGRLLPSDHETFIMSLSSCLIPLLLATSVLSRVPPVLSARQYTSGTTLKLTAQIPEVIQQQVNTSFPDPAVIQGPQGKWWAYATAAALPGPRIQLASADDPNGPWTFLEGEDAKSASTWSSTDSDWAPDVQHTAIRNM